MTRGPSNPAHRTNHFHNLEGLFQRISEICSGAPSALVSVAAFHWYSGDHFQALELVHRAFPELLLIFTEGCIEYSNSEPDSQLVVPARGIISLRYQEECPS